MKRLLEDYIEDIDIEDVANDEVSSQQDKSEITYDFRLVISIVNDEGVDKATKAAHRILEKYSEIASYNTSVFKSDKPEQNNMYNYYQPCFIIEFSLERHFRNPQNAFRFFSSLLNTHRYINGPLSSLKMNQTSQYVQLYYNNQVFFSKPTEEFYIIRLLAENAFKGIKVENQISIYSDIYRQLVGTLTILTDSASQSGDFLLELFYLKDAFTNKLAKYILRSPKLMKLSAKSKKFLENHTINLDALFNQQNDITQIYMENIDTMFLDTHQRGFNSIPFTTWGSYGESIDMAKKALYNQKEVRLHSVCARYDSISYSHMGAGRVNISAYLCTYQNSNPSDTDSFFILLESSWMHLDKLIQALKEILDEELPECLVKDIMKIAEDRM